MRRLGGRKKMLSFVNWKTDVMFLIFWMCTHQRFLPLLIVLEKKNKCPTLWQTTKIWNWLQWQDLVLPLKVHKNFEMVRKSRSTHPLNLYYQYIIPLSKISITTGAFSFSQTWSKVIIKKLIEERKKTINDTNGQYPLPTYYSWQWKEEETNETLLAMLEERNKKRIRICFIYIALINHPFASIHLSNCTAET